MKALICFECNKRIDNINDYKMYAIDRPYVNLFFHKSCFLLVGGYGNIAEYCCQKIELVYNYQYNIIGRKKNK
jgi:hypothetical protein